MNVIHNMATGAIEIRGRNYGSGSNLEAAAGMWTELIAAKIRKSTCLSEFSITPIDLCLMMAALKIARYISGNMTDINKLDTLVDIVGYIYLASDLEEETNLSYKQLMDNWKGTSDEPEDSDSE